jgi:hypothetical protein
MTDGTTDRASSFKRLRISLHRLATAGAEQRTLFPDSAASAGELASDYDQSATVIREDFEGELSPSQSEALAAIDRKLVLMSRDEAEFGVELWTDGAVSTSEHWAEIRRLAAAALEAFGWPLESFSESSGSAS